jgi:hypothetical protein
MPNGGRAVAYKLEQSNHNLDRNTPGPDSHSLAVNIFSRSPNEEPGKAPNEIFDSTRALLANADSCETSPDSANCPRD